MVDLTKAEAGSMWINRSGDLMMLDVNDDIGVGAVRMYFQTCESEPMYIGKFVRVFRSNGLSCYGSTRFDIVSQLYSECPY
jgi:hypothetical protein